MRFGSWDRYDWFLVAIILAAIALLVWFLADTFIAGLA